MNKLKFGRGNAKLDRQTATFSLPAGHTCPGACKCLSKADKNTGKITDGEQTEFRCFAASEEKWRNVRGSRWWNMGLLREVGIKAGMSALILRSLPSWARYVRIHVSGDFFSQAYFDAWAEVAALRPDIVFYAYTKSLNYWVARKNTLPPNFRLTASRGGKFDSLIEEHGFPDAEVVFHPDDAGDRPLDKDDSHARAVERDSFALLLHGTQPKGSSASEALKRLRKEDIKFAYSK